MEVTPVVGVARLLAELQGALQDLAISPPDVADPAAWAAEQLQGCLGLAEKIGAAAAACPEPDELPMLGEVMAALTAMWALDLQHVQGRQATGADTARGKEAEKRRAVIEHTISSKEYGLTFDDIAGLEHAKTTLREAVIMPVNYPHLFTGARVPWTSVLFYGPPGTGKTRLARALASELTGTYYCVSSSDLMSSWVGESEKLIRELFTHARAAEGTSILFMDEMDGLCRKRSEHENEHTRRVKTELLKCMEGASEDNLFLLASTNCPWEIDSAFLRRFEKQVLVSVPTTEARLELLRMNLSGLSTSITEADLDQIAVATERFTGSDILGLVREAAMVSVRDATAATTWRREGVTWTPCPASHPLAEHHSFLELPSDEVQVRAVTREDLELALQQTQPIVSPEQLRRFVSFGPGGGGAVAM